MKKTLQFLFLISLSFLLFITPAYANTARWTNASDVIISHGYHDGFAECYVYIDCYPNCSVTNVDIYFDMYTSNGWASVSQWTGLSGTETFCFEELVPIENPTTTYRLSITAEITQNGVVETIEKYKNVVYSED